MNDDEIQFLDDNEPNRSDGEPPRAKAVSVANDSPYVTPHSADPTSAVEGLVIPEIVPAPKSRFGLWFLAWPILILGVAFIAAQPFLIEEEEGVQGDSSAELSALEAQGRYIVGTASLPTFRDNEAQLNDLYVSTQAMNTGSWESRLCFTILAGELMGADEAIETLEALPVAAKNADYEPTEEQVRLHGLLLDLYGDYSKEEWKAPSLEDEDRTFLTERLGWYGTLALTPTDTPEVEQRDSLEQAAQMTAIAIAVGFLLGTATGFGGLTALVMFIIQGFRGKIRFRLERFSINGNIYIETFVLWFALFLLFSLLSAFVIPEDAPIIALGSVQLFSLIALAWPVIRGVPWSKLRREIGLYAKNPLVEVFWGGICYAATLPLVACGLACMFVMMAVAGMFEEVNEFQSVSGPTHPIGEWLGEAGWIGVLQIFILAAVIAPIVEETMFRGVFYRHLRDMSAKTRVIISVVVATLVNSFIFAIIHPQGIFGVPLLMSLSIGFSLAREWRGSLVAPMIMHAINNGAVTIIGSFLL